MELFPTGEGKRSLRTGVSIPLGRVCTPDPSGSVGLIRANGQVRSERHEQFECRYANLSHRPMRMVRMPLCELFVCPDTNGSYRAVRADLFYLDFAEPFERVSLCIIRHFLSRLPTHRKRFQHRRFGTRRLNPPSRTRFSASFVRAKRNNRFSGKIASL